MRAKSACSMRKCCQIFDMLWLFFLFEWINLVWAMCNWDIVTCMYLSSHQAKMQHKAISLWGPCRIQDSCTAGAKNTSPHRYFSLGVPQTPSNQLKPAKHLKPGTKFSRTIMTTYCKCLVENKLFYSDLSFSEFSESWKRNKSLYPNCTLISQKLFWWKDL